MGRFRLKHTMPSHGLSRVHDMRDLHTGRLLDRISLWADTEEVLPELVAEFLIESQLVPEDFQLDLQSGLNGEYEAAPPNE